MLAETCSQMHAQMKYSVAHLQDLIPTFAGVMTNIFYISQVEIKSCTLGREYALFVHVFGYIFELTVTGW